MAIFPAESRLGKHLPHVKFIYPNAPALHITIYGMMTPAWYDFLSPSASSINHEQDEKGMLRSRQQVLQIVRDEMETSNIPANRIVIGGFSQGCVLSLLTGLTSEYRFAGIASLSGYLPLPEKIMDMATDANRKTPIFWGHGTADQAVKYEFGEETVEFLQKNNYAVDFHSYKRMGHSASIEEITDLLAFFKQTIPEQQPVTAKI
ncbi:hypothetical protein BGZ99_003524 [Dissophora globulifera]|uniref:Acyl-protein thioesterase 1 n=1 Tax=Dissophora globulifera TaxID=979702 RepID=A0A9P6UVZ2_9FUNG|nr:hypothetical protein BGZ99_003524 [Dissophora globulifera]